MKRKCWECKKLRPAEQLGTEDDRCFGCRSSYHGNDVTNHKIFPLEQCQGILELAVMENGDVRVLSTDLAPGNSHFNFVVGNVHA